MERVEPGRLVLPRGRRRDPAPGMVAAGSGSAPGPRIPTPPRSPRRPDCLTSILLVLSPRTRPPAPSTPGQPGHGRDRQSLPDVPAWYSRWSVQRPGREPGPAASRPSRPRGGRSARFPPVVARRPVRSAGLPLGIGKLGDDDPAGRLGVDGHARTFRRWPFRASSGRARSKSSRTGSTSPAHDIQHRPDGRPRSRGRTRPARARPAGGRSGTGSSSSPGSARQAGPNSQPARLGSSRVSSAPGRVRRTSPAPLPGDLGRSRTRTPTPGGTHRLAHGIAPIAPRPRGPLAQAFRGSSAGRSSVR